MISGIEVIVAAVKEATLCTSDILLRWTSELSDQSDPISEKSGRSSRDAPSPRTCRQLLNPTLGPLFLQNYLNAASPVGVYRIAVAN